MSNTGTPIPDRVFNKCGYPTVEHKRFPLPLRDGIKVKGYSFGPGDKFILGSSTGMTHWFTAATSMHCKEVEKHRGEDALWIEGEIMGDADPNHFRFIHLRKDASLDIALAIFAYEYPLYKKTAGLGVAAGAITFGEIRLGRYQFVKNLPTIRHLLVIALLEPQALPDIRCVWEGKQDPSAMRLLGLWMESDPGIKCS